MRASLLLLILLSLSVQAVPVSVINPDGTEPNPPAPTVPVSDVAALGDPDSYVIINAGTTVNNWPWSTSLGNSMRFQMLYLKTEIGRSGHINGFAFQNPNTVQRRFNNITIKMCNTPITAVQAADMDANYGGISPETVFTATTRRIGSGVAGGWDSLPVSFDYDSAYNLLVEVFWNTAETISGNPQCWYGSRSPNRRTWCWNYLGNVGVSADAYCYNARLSFDDIFSDVGCTRILVPSGALDSGAVVTPACSVRNFGTLAASYDVRMKIGTGYDQTASVSVQPPGTVVYVTFPNWTAGPRGSLATACSTELAVDQTPGNDKTTGTVTVNVADVGVSDILSPTGAIDSGSAVTPACSVANFGTTTPAGYTVRMKIGADYDLTADVTGPAPGAKAYVTFPDWTATARGSNALTCSTEFAGDMIPINDWLSGAIDVAVHDWQATAINTPSGSLPPGTVTPEVTVRNTGTARETGKAWFHINAVPTYAESLDLAGGLPPGIDTTLVFPDWTAAAGSYTARCSVGATGDQVAANDVVSAPFSVGDVDVAATVIVAPAGSYDTGAAITPSAKVRNLSDFAVTFETRFRLKNAADSVVFSEDVTVTGLTAGTETTVVFSEWTKPHEPGTYSAQCSVELAGDGNPGNNLVRGTFRIVAGGGGGGGETGWVRKADLPLGAKGKKVKDGGCLAYGEVNDTGYVYALKGNNRYEFYAYNTNDNVWVTKESIPAIGRAGKKKAVKKGSTIVVHTDEDWVFGAKGNNSLEWWAYDPALHTWTQKADVPMGAKNLKEGTGAVAVSVNDTAWIYLLRGANSTDFHRYNVAADAWESKAPAPVGASGKNYKNGSCLATDGTTIWALKGSYNELAAYDIAANAWTTRTGLPLIGRLGKKKKVKDGAGLACHDGYVYAQKGGNTPEFWKYKADTLGGPADVWTQIEDVPFGSGKNVKGGGALCYGDLPYPALYEFKGNNTCDFFKYGFAAVTVGQASSLSSSSSVLSSERQARCLSYLRIAPNPWRGSELPLAISYRLPRAGNMSLKLYDITGQLVTTLADGYRNPGSNTISVNQRSSAVNLNSGIYILRLATEASTTTTKLVIE